MMDATEPKNLVITKLNPKLYNLFHALCEINSVSKEHLIEAMLFDQCQKFLNDRAKEIDVEPEIFEALEEGIEQAFRSTVLHRARYQPIYEVPIHEREQVLAKMVRQKR